MSYVIIDENADQEYAKELLKSQFSGTILSLVLDDEGAMESGIRVSADNTFESEELPEPHESVSNGHSNIDMYHVGGATIFVESGVNDGLGIYPANAKIRDYFLDWDFGCDDATGLAEFGLEPNLDEASDDDEDVRIWITYHYFAGTLSAPNNGFVRSEDGEIMSFPTYAEAEIWIAETISGNMVGEFYCLKHGEAAAPDYTIVK